MLDWENIIEKGRIRILIEKNVFLSFKHEGLCSTRRLVTTSPFFVDACDKDHSEVDQRDPLLVLRRLILLLPVFY